MRITSRRKAIAFFLALGICLVVLAVALNVGWVILSWREGVKLFFGVVFFAAIILGLILNTGFLVREIRRNEQHDSFINAVTHELKTPITSIRLYLETLQRRDVGEAQRQEFYRSMLLDTERLLGTVEQVLKAGEATYSRRGAKHRIELDFAAVVRDCVQVAQTRHHLQEGALRYQQHANGTSTHIEGDPEKLRTAVSNMLDNAIKYSGNRVDVSVDLDVPSPERIVLRVRDAGVGIPSHELKRIFKRFYRVPAHSRSTVKGTGLGLFIVRSIARMHGGRVFAESEGEAALDRLLKRGEAFDAIVLDVMLPGKDGFAVATELRKARNYAPILMLTARGRPEDVLQGFAAGADDYLPKPFELPIFLARLRGLLRRTEWSRKGNAATAGAGAEGDFSSGSPESGSIFSFDDITIDFNALELRTNGSTIRLTLMESKLLRHLIRSSGRTVSRRSILQDVWDLSEDTDTRAIDNFIVRLRRYIEKNPSKPRHLLTVRGVGYRFVT